MKFILASNNSKKIKELTDILAPLGYDLVTQSSLNISEAIEDGLSFVENALKKARHASQHSGLPAIADDSGIEVSALQGKPGIYSARFAGENASDGENLQKLLDETADIPDNELQARYCCVIVMLRHANDPMPIIAQGTWEGYLRREPKGDGGFGYDPIFCFDDSGKTAAEISASDKAGLSHRGKALREFDSLFRQVDF